MCADRRAGPVAGTPRDRDGLVAFALVFTIALTIRLLHLYGQAHDNPFFASPVMDEKMHHEWAQRIASGVGLGDKPFFRAPLYYYLLAGLYAVCGPSLAIARTVGVVLGACSCVLIARLGDALAGRRVAIVAGLLAAFYWPFVVFDGELLSAGLEIFLNVLTLLLLVRAGQAPSSRRWLAAGIVWGLSAIARPNVLVIAPVVVAWIGLQTAPALRRQRVWRACSLVAVGAALAIAPVTLHNRLVGNEWSLIATNGGVNFYIGNNPQADGMAALVPGTRMDWAGGFEDTHRIADLDLGRKLSEVEVSNYWRDKAVAWIAAEPSAWLRLVGHKLRLFFAPVEISNNQGTWFFARLSPISAIYWLGFPVVACLAFAGLAMLRARWRDWLLPLGFFVTYAASVVLFFCPDRYRLPAVPILILLAAAGLVFVVERCRERGARGLATYLAAGALAALFLATNPPDRAQFRRNHDGNGHKSLALHYLRSGEPALAALHARQAIDLRPYDPAPHLILARALSAEHLPNQVEDQYRQALATAPDFPDANTEYAEYLASANRLDEAVPRLEHVLASNPARIDVHLALAKALLALNRTQEALPHARLVVANEPESEEARDVLVSALESVSDADAVAELRILASAFPKDAFVLDELAWRRATAHEAAQRDGTEALRLTRQVQQLAGRPWPRFLSTLGAAYAEVGDFDLALRCEQQAQQLSTASPANAARPGTQERQALYGLNRPYHRD